MMALAFTVYGVAEPAGSKDAFVPKGWRRPIVTDANKNLKGWMQLVKDGASQALAAQAAADRTLLLGGVRLTVAMYLPRPQSLPKKQTEMITTPDCDKVVRGIQDALTGIAYGDDKQITELLAVKRYAAAGEPARVYVRVEPAHVAAPAAVRLDRSTDLPLFDEAVL
jgi:Holliday junction resolvase RusA-like endonuclease